MLTSRNQFSYSHLFLFLFLWKSFSTLSPYLFAERRVSDSGPTRESSKEHSTRSGRLSTSSIGGSQPLTRLARLLNQRPSFTPSDEIPRRLSWERYVTKSAIVKFLKYRTSLRRLEKGRRRRRRRRRKKRKKPKKKEKKNWSETIAAERTASTTPEASFDELLSERDLFRNKLRTSYYFSQHRSWYADTESLLPDGSSSSGGYLAPRSWIATDKFTGYLQLRFCNIEWLIRVNLTRQ